MKKSFPTTTIEEEMARRADTTLPQHSVNMNSPEAERRKNHKRARRVYKNILIYYLEQWPDFERLGLTKLE